MSAGIPYRHHREGGGEAYLDRKDIVVTVNGGVRAGVDMDPVALSTKLSMNMSKAVGDEDDPGTRIRTWVVPVLRPVPRKVDSPIG